MVHGDTAERLVRSQKKVRQLQQTLQDLHAVEEEKKRRKAELNALSPATRAAFEADMPVYELSVALENVIVVDCLEKIEVMRSLLFAHHQHHHHL